MIRRERRLRPVDVYRHGSGVEHEFRTPYTTQGRPTLAVGRQVSRLGGLDEAGISTSGNDPCPNRRCLH